MDVCKAIIPAAGLGTRFQLCHGGHRLHRAPGQAPVPGILRQVFRGRRQSLRTTAKTPEGIGLKGA